MLLLGVCVYFFSAYSKLLNLLSRCGFMRAAKAFFVREARPSPSAWDPKHYNTPRPGTFPKLQISHAQAFTVQGLHHS